jgi:hypothetical protein
MAAAAVVVTRFCGNDEIWSSRKGLIFRPSPISSANTQRSLGIAGGNVGYGLDYLTYFLSEQGHLVCT